MRILTYNVHGWRTIDDRPNLNLVAKLLKSAEADVIGLNEVYHPAITNTQVALEWLAEQLGMTCVFAACEAQGRLGTSRVSSYGNALLSRAPLAFVSTGLFSTIVGKEQRGYLEGRIGIGDRQTFDVVVTHLDHTDEQTRLTQFADLLLAVGQGNSAPDLIMGDFNCVHPKEYEHRPEALKKLSAYALAKHLVNEPHGPQLCNRMEDAGYIDVLVQKGLLGKGTFIPTEERVRLDYLWLSANWVANLTAVDILDEPAGQEASDHRPVLADLELPQS